MLEARTHRQASLVDSGVRQLSLHQRPHRTQTIVRPRTGMDSITLSVLAAALLPNSRYKGRRSNSHNNGLSSNSSLNHKSKVHQSSKTRKNQTPGYSKSSTLIWPRCTAEVSLVGMPYPHPATWKSMARKKLQLRHTNMCMERIASTSHMTHNTTTRRKSHTLMLVTPTSMLTAAKSRTMKTQTMCISASIDRGGGQRTTSATKFCVSRLYRRNTTVAMRANMSRQLPVKHPQPFPPAKYPRILLTRH